MNKHLLSRLVVVFVVLLSACSKRMELKEIIKTEQGHFRGINIDDSPEKVLSIEDSTKLADRNRVNSYLYYDIPMKKKGTTKNANSFTIAYNFEDEKLYEIQVDIYIEDQSDCEHIYEGLIDLFERKYGPHTKDEDYLVWNTRTSEGDNISYELVDESSQYKSGKLSLTIFNVDY